MNHATQYRRDLHQIPETSFEEFKTKEYLVHVLSALNCEIIPVLETGVLAYFDAGKDQTLAYRADMDALPVTEETGLEFASKHPGRMHACGHDGHMAILLGFAEELDAMDRSAWKYNILLVFQPSEETVGGARPILETGVFEKFQVKAIYGTHVYPFLPAGVIGSRSGELMAHASEVTVTLHGKSTHCAKPDEGIDALAAGAELLCRLYALEKSFDPGIYRLLKFGNFHAGTVRNILPETCVMEGSYRSFQPEVFAKLIDGSQNIMRQLEQETGCQIDFAYTEGYPAVINDADLFKQVQALCPELTVLDKPEMIAEDFAFYQERVPGVFLFLGTGTGIPLHNCHFTFDEAILQSGIRTYIRLMETEL